MTSRLMEVYGQLSTDVQGLIQLAAVYFGGINRTDLVKMASQFGLKASDGRALDYKELQPDIAKAIDHGLLVKETNGSQLVVHESVLDQLVQLSVTEGTFSQWAKIVRSHFEKRAYSHSFGNRQGAALQRDARIAFYSGDVQQLQELIDSATHSTEATRQSIGVLSPFNAEIFRGLPIKLQTVFISDAIIHAVTDGDGEPELLAVAHDVYGRIPKTESAFISVFVDMLFAAGDIKTLQQIDQDLSGGCPKAIGCVSMLTGHFGKALSHFENAFKVEKKATMRKALPGLPGVLHICLLLRTLDAADRKRASQMIAAITHDCSDTEYFIREMLSQACKRQLFSKNVTFLKNVYGLTHQTFASLLATYLWKWVAPNQSAPIAAKHLELAAQRYNHLGLTFFATECQLAARHATSADADAESTSPTAADLHSASGTASLFELIKPESAWKKSLQALQFLVDQQSSKTTDSSSLPTERMIWELQGVSSWLQVRPYIQKVSKSGAWTKGRPVSLERLYRQASRSGEFDFLTDQDTEICRCIKETVDNSSYYKEVFYNFVPEQLARALAGHPLVFAEGNRSEPIDIVLREPQLIVEKKPGDQVSLRIDPPIADDTELQVSKIGPHKIEICLSSAKHRQVAAAIGNQLSVPKTGLPMIQKLLGSLSDLVSVQSELDAEGGSAGEVEANALPHIHLSQFQSGLRAEFFIHPFGQSGPALHPGQGAANLFANVDGKSSSATRDLKHEFDSADKIVQACNALQEQCGSQSDATHWMFEFPGADQALEFSLQIQPLVEKRAVIIHWPKGKTLQVVGEASSNQLRINLKSDRDWFAASGKLQVPGQEKIDMMKLIELVQTSPSRFIELNDGQFLALTDKFRDRIETLAAYTSHQKTKLRFAPVQAAVLEDLADKFNVKADKHWKNQVQRIRDAGELQPEVPSTFQAEMRDYQLEGFRWMSRLSAWGAGACLADDMGLGKTIQALALLAQRGKDGPALVVAPTSVGFNWVNETARFAPTLRPKVFGQGNRDETLGELGPHDVVICSYGLLHSEAERIQKVAWHTVVLDEAQAIKNYETKRSQAAMGLQAGFRLILTGTPLENHLGELWNLFEFINPGLLGSQTTFRDRFAIPIERDGCRATRQRLKRLVQPFILRRTKTEVLEELPSRTEVTLQVDLSTEEAAFYEALRQRAIEKLAETADDNKQSMQVLAEITRLRLACCHPKLVTQESSLSSSKLDLFARTISDLTEGDHKVLVFSQFVGHLQILRERLETMDITYQYLDGSTPVKQRQANVAAFQAGEGEVFLISLKAGGTGLNLTAADYVIHMDPWWNPAVEDQASDRAHRLGQTRPVTIYRFVTQGTIEEQIVQLHRSKRDLADSLLEGTDMSGKLTTAELIRLIKG
ncbi:MAG: DEAD/DEAH box helicase [Pirellulaceae bacterium]